MLWCGSIFDALALTADSAPSVTKFAPLSCAYASGIRLPTRRTGLPSSFGSVRRGRDTAADETPRLAVFLRLDRLRADRVAVPLPPLRLVEPESTSELRHLRP